MEKAISTLELSHEQWLNERRKGIGGSDVAAILGLSKFKTPLDIYNQKVNDEVVPVNNAMKAGIILEDAVATWYTVESGRKIIRDNKIRVHREHPFLYANLDRIILPENGEGRGVLEIKTANYFAARYWEETPPVEYILQIQHYFDVTGYSWGEFAVLVGGCDFRRYYIERDQELIDIKNEKLSEFWNNNILSQVPPEPVNESDLERLYGRSVEGKSIEAAPATANIVEELKVVKSQIKSLEEREEALSESLKIALKDAEILMHHGDVLCTWKTAKDSNSFDSKTFKAEHPDLYNQYLVAKPGSRRFIIK